MSKSPATSEEDFDEEYDFTDPDGNPYGVQLFPVKTATGNPLQLQTNDEAEYYEDRKNLYLTHNKFTNVSDLQDLDRLLMLEVMIMRWSTWMAQGFDYMMTRVDESAMKTYISDYSKEIRAVKASLGIDKATREKDKGEDIASYLQNLLRRAKEFGYHRDEQYQKSVTLIYHLKTLVGTYDRCDEEERETLDLSPDSILDWIRENMVKEWDAIDEAFRSNQKMWIREL